MPVYCYLQLRWYFHVLLVSGNNEHLYPINEVMIAEIKSLTVQMPDVDSDFTAAVDIILSDWIDNTENMFDKATRKLTHILEALHTLDMD